MTEKAVTATPNDVPRPICRRCRTRPVSPSRVVRQHYVCSTCEYRQRKARHPEAVRAKHRADFARYYAKRGTREHYTAYRREYRKREVMVGPHRIMAETPEQAAALRQHIKERTLVAQQRFQTRAEAESRALGADAAQTAP